MPDGFEKAQRLDGEGGRMKGTPVTINVTPAVISIKVEEDEDDEEDDAEK